MPWDLLSENYSCFCGSGKDTKLNGSVQAQGSQLQGGYLRHSYFSSASIFQEAETCAWIEIVAHYLNLSE